MSNRATDTEQGLSGRALQQSPEQWALRGEALTGSLVAMANRTLARPVAEGLDVGCQDGSVTDAVAARLGGTWYGIDPRIDPATPAMSPSGRELRHGWAQRIPFGDRRFDMCLFANVFEHVEPRDRFAALFELRRVLRPGGVIVGQIPNPYFPIESHSRLPLMGYLPIAWQKRYWRLAPVPWEHDFYVVTMSQLAHMASRVGLTVVESSRFSYPVEVVPHAVQWAARMLRPVTRWIPWAWQFVLRRPAGS